MHNLATTNGKPAMAYTGEPPWHGLGTKLDSPMTAREAIEAAGLDYTVELTPLQTVAGKPVPQRQAVVRQDTEAVLGVVGNAYAPVQNRDCFSFLDAVVADGGLRYHTAGALGQGERVWLLAKLPGHIRIKNTDDLTEKYLLLDNSHDGSSALRVHLTPIRVVCQNTLTLAARQAKGEGVAIVHKGDLAAKVRQAQAVLGLAQRGYDDLEAQFNRLAHHYPTWAQIDHYFGSLYPDPPEGNKTRAENTRNELYRLFETGIGQDMPGIQFTAWAALNAVTEYVDHHRPTRGPRRAANPAARSSRRLQSAWFGTGARIKRRALELALKMPLAL